MLLVLALIVFVLPTPLADLGRSYMQGYNAQVAVDGQAQVIVSQHVTNTAADLNELIPVA